MYFYSGVSNYRETPYIISDTFANKVNYSAAIKGAIYICRDGASLSEPSIYQANGTVWVAIGAYGIGTDATLQDVTTNGNTTDKGITITALGLSTNTLTVTSLTPKSIPFVGTADLLTEDNTNLVWDNVNKWLGIQTNTPTSELDIHSTTSAPMIALNNTAGLSSRILFINNNVNKWTIGNSATNTFNIFNQVLGLNAVSIASNSVATFAKDAIINTLTIGLGNGSFATNTALGLQALNTNSTGTQNLAIGYNSLSANTSGGLNVASGYNSLLSNNIGSNNVANGAFSLQLNTSGNENTANGKSSLSNNTIGINNTASGSQSLQSNIIGNYNTGIGASSLLNNIADNNTATGYNSLYINSSGINNTAIGYQAGYAGSANANSTGSNNIFIGNNSVGTAATDSNKTFIGNSSTTQTFVGGNLLIGTTNDVGATINAVGGIIRVKNVDADTGLDLQENGSIGLIRQRNNRPLGFYTNNVEAMRINVAGNVGIGTTAPIGNLDVASLNPSLYIRNLTNVGVTLGQTNGELDFYSDDSSGIGPHILSSIKSVHDGSSLLAPAGALTFSTAIQGVAQIEAMRISSSGNVLIGLTIDTTLAKLQIAGNLQLTATGNKLLINATVNTAAAGASTAGSTTLIAGTIVVSTTAVTANSIILITAQSGTITGSLKISARSAGTSFTILSTVLTDTPLVGWLIIN